MQDLPFRSPILGKLQLRNRWPPSAPFNCLSVAFTVLHDGQKLLEVSHKDDTFAAKRSGILHYILQ